MGGSFIRYITFLILFCFAQQAICDENGAIREVVVHDYRYIPPLNFPSAFSTSVKTSDFFGEYNTSSELLNFSSGVNIRDFGGPGQLKTISIRGSSDDQVVVMLDGIRLNTPLSGGVDLSTIPLGYVDEFEIVRGGASALAGSDAIGGVVNIKTKSFEDKFSSGSLTYGSFNTLSAGLSRADKIGDFGYLLSFNYSRSDGDFEYESVNGLRLERINNEYDSFSFLGKAGYKVSGWELTVLNEFFYSDKGVPGLGEFQEPDSNQKDLRNLTNLRLKKESFLDGNTDLEANIFSRINKFEFKNPDPLVGIPVNTDNDVYSVGSNTKLSWHASDSHKATFSGEIKYDILRDADYSNPERLNISLFTGDEIRLFDRRLLIHPIARVDYYRTKGQDDDSNDFTLSPKLGSIFHITDRFLLKGNISYSNRLPNFSELYYPEQGFIGGNPDLENEKSFDFDFGISFLHPKIAFDINYFRADVEDSILFVFISSQRIEPRNVGDVMQQGIESNLIISPLSFLEIFAAYTYLNGKVEDTGSQLPGRPENKLDIRFVLKNSWLKAYWETKFVDEIPLSFFPDSRKTDSRTTHDIGVRGSWKNCFATLEVKNLFSNLDVRDALDFPLPGRSVFLTAGINLRR